MYNCLVILGKPNSGKTYAAYFIKKKMNVKTIHFDFLISIVCESIRKYFEKKKFEEKEKMWYREGLDVSNNEFAILLCDLNKLISKNTDFFENLYVKSIKGTRPSWSHRPGIDKQRVIMDLVKLSKLLNPYGSHIMDLAKLSKLLNPYGSHIMDLVFLHIIKGSLHFVIEGIYFSRGTNFLKKLETRCNKISYLQTFYNQITRRYSYKYNTIKAKSLDEIIKNLKDELKFG